VGRLAGAIKSDNRSHYQDFVRKGSDSIGMSWNKSGVGRGMSRIHMIAPARLRPCEKMQKLRKSTVREIAGSSAVSLNIAFVIFASYLKFGSDLIRAVAIA
jgi:hypothetical protein